MPYLNNLATELLCKIFNSVTDSVDDGIIKDPTVAARGGGAQVMGGTPTRGVIAPTSDAYKLPELKSTILASFTLSHVCKTWRKIVLERPEMWQRLHISYRQLLGLGKMLRTVLVRSHPYPLHLDVSLLGCKWHLSGEVYTAARRQLDEFIMRCASVRVEGNHFALAALLKIFERHNLKARTKAGIKWLHVVENFCDANTNIPSGPFPLDRIAPQLICLNAQFAGASRFPPGMDRIIFEDHLFKREVYWDAFSISGAKHIVLSNVGIPRPYHRLGIMLGPLPPRFPGDMPYVSPRDKYLARTGSTLTSITFHALHDYRHERGCTIRAGDIMQHAAGQLFQEIFLKRVAATLEKVQFVNITKYTWAGFITACEHIQFDFPRVHTLRLEDVHIDAGADDFGLLARVFPNLTQLTVKGMGHPHGVNLMRLFLGDAFVWPEMREIEFDGVLVDRKAVGIQKLAVVTSRIL